MLLRFSSRLDLMIGKPSSHCLEQKPGDSHSQEQSKFRKHHKYLIQTWDCFLSCCFGCQVGFPGSTLEGSSGSLFFRQTDVVVLLTAADIPASGETSLYCCRLQQSEMFMRGMAKNYHSTKFCSLSKLCECHRFSFCL